MRRNACAELLEYFRFTLLIIAQVSYAEEDDEIMCALKNILLNEIATLERALTEESSSSRLTSSVRENTAGLSPRTPENDVGQPIGQVDRPKLPNGQEQVASLSRTDLS